MEYLLGSKQDFFNFVNSINEEDRVGIVTHTDLDGIASAIFLEKILEAKNIDIDFIEFLDYKNLEHAVEGKEFSKLFILDFNYDGYPDEFEKLRAKGRVLLIDHHPINKNLGDKEGIIKTEARDCTSLVMYNLAKEFIDVSEWNWLVCSSIIADYCFLKKENLELIKSFYPSTTEESVFESVPGELAKKINSALIYYEDYKKIYDLIIKEDFKIFDEAHEIVEDEIAKWVKEFKEKKEFYYEKNLYFWYFNPKYGIVSTVAFILSRKSPDKLFILLSDADDGLVKISARYQRGSVHLGELLQKCIDGFENARAGGHPQAAAGSLLKKDLDKFKQRLLDNINL